MIHKSCCSYVVGDFDMPGGCFKAGAAEAVAWLMLTLYEPTTG